MFRPENCPLALQPSPPPPPTIPSRSAKKSETFQTVISGGLTSSIPRSPMSSTLSPSCRTELGRPSLAEMSFDSFRIPVYEGSSRLGTAEDLDLNILDLNMTPYPRVIHQPRYPTAVLLSPGWPSSLPDPSVVAKLSVCQSVLSLI